MHHKTTRSPIRLFVRIKDLREVDPKNESFRIRFRYFAYFDDDAIEKQLTVAEAAKLSDLAARKFKVSTDDLSKKVHCLLPHFSISNKISVTSVGAVEFMVKPKATVGFNFCLTAQHDAVVAHAFDMRTFPFDHHALQLEFALKKAADIERWKLEIDGDSKFADPKESIPFYVEVERRPWMPEGWREHAYSPFEMEEIDCAEWSIHAAGGTLTPWDISRCNQKKPRAAFTLHITRRHNFYFRDVMLLNSMLTSLVFLSPAGSLMFDVRMQNDLVLLLTSVAFSIAMNSNMPVLPYATYTTFHFNVCIWSMVVISVMHAVLSELAVVAWVDRVAHGVVLCPWMAYHIWMFGVVRRQRNYNMTAFGPALRSVYETGMTAYPSQVRNAHERDRAVELRSVVPVQ